MKMHARAFAIKFGGVVRPRRFRRNVETAVADPLALLRCCAPFVKHRADRAAAPPWFVAPYPRAGAGRPRDEAMQLDRHLFPRPPRLHPQFTT
jgi:hypothetical protein